MNKIFLQVKRNYRKKQSGTQIDQVKFGSVEASTIGDFLGQLFDLCY